MATHRSNKLLPTCTHWGNYLLETSNNKVVAVHPYPADKNPTELRQNLLASQDPKARVAQPMVRQSYLHAPEASDTARRGCEPFVAVEWDTALDLAAAALQRAKDNHGNQSIYGGSYGWASAGRFHHAQSQLHRFLNGHGGYTKSVNSYSAAAAEVIIPHVLGMPFMKLVYEAPTAEDIAAHCKTLVLFGGAPMKNNQVNAGGLGSHSAAQQLQGIADAGVEVFNVSPIKNDTADFLKAKWLPVHPCSDVALMLGLAHTLYVENLHDIDFLSTYCEGFDEFLPYLLGSSDGQPKDAQWAASKCGLPTSDIQALARTLAKGRSVLGISWSLQRQEHGEQSYWMITVLGAMLGDLGKPGGGVGYGYGCIHNMGFAGRRLPPFSLGALPQGPNAVKDYIPVARIVDMLESPGAEFDFNGERLKYPDIQLIYWAGGNPFHHHQDLNRLRKAWQEPETIIVNEPFWTATAQHADIVFPATTALERNDFGGGSADCFLSPMQKALQPFEQARNDYDIFSELAERLGFADSFTENLSEIEWVQRLYEVTRSNAEKREVFLPGFEQFWQGEQLDYGPQLDDARFTLEEFRANPDDKPLKTPSGKIEIFSKTIAEFAYADCLGHPAWFEKNEWAGSELSEQHRFHLISNQPKSRLHSQYDHGPHSQAEKINGMQPVRINPHDAQKMRIQQGDQVKIYNGRGACLAAAVLSEEISRGVVELATGAWYSSAEPTSAKGLELSGNPNVLTADSGTSSLAQGTSAHSCLVSLEAYKA